MYLVIDQDYLPTSDVDAKALGLSMYFTGKPCRYGHVTARYASSAECVFCRQIKNTNVELKKKQKVANEKNKESRKQKSIERYQRNIEFERIRYQSKWINNKEKMTARTKNWEQRNSEKRLAIAKANNALRKHKIKEQSPKWANKQKIQEMYMNCPKGYHVDHIIPLKGKTVSGLHVETNLQYLTASENCKKHNKFGEQYAI